MDAHSSGTVPIRAPQIGKKPHSSRNRSKGERRRCRRLRMSALKKQGYRCCWCEEPLSETQVTAEHLNPRVKGGPVTHRNIAASCVDCNQVKGSTPPKVFRALIQTPVPGVPLRYWVVHVRWRIWSRQRQAEAAILATVGLKPGRPV
jgi:5-methylcytosine-specific restriction endonuclease McrA